MEGQVKHKGQFKFRWSDEKHEKWLELYNAHCVNHGEPVFADVRPKRSMYHLNVLCNVVNKLLGVNSPDMLEIGCYKGDSTTIFAGHFFTVTAVDPFGLVNQHSPVDDMEESNESKGDSMDVYVKTADENELVLYMFENNCVDFATNIEFHRLTSDDYFLLHPETKFDFIYVDGDHRYSQQMRDYTNAMNSITPNGIIGGHDFSWESTQKVIRDLGWADAPILHFGDDSFIVVPEDLL